MKNKTLIKAELALTRKLLDVVNSKEEWEALRRDEVELLCRLGLSSQAMTAIVEIRKAAGVGWEELGVAVGKVARASGLERKECLQELKGGSYGECQIGVKED